MHEMIRQFARELGFELLGILPVEASRTHPIYRRWVEAGYGGEMTYLKRHLPLKRDPRTILPEARTLLCLAINYHTYDFPSEAHADPTVGLVSRYAWGEDYHELLHERLERLLVRIQREIPCQGRHCVDSAPILEREYAERAGLGWLGKNTNLIHWQLGSYLFLCELLLDVEIPADPLPARGSCGTCTRCIEACPTDAILADRTLDARRCISYLTIELKGAIPESLREGLGHWIFGCDVCQEVCPWNRRAPMSSEPAFRPRKKLWLPRLSSLLMELLPLSARQFQRRFARSPLRRARRRGLLRNILVALGNAKDRNGLSAVQNALADRDPIVREHAAWALGQMRGNRTRQHLHQRLTGELKGPRKMKRKG